MPPLTREDVLSCMCSRWLPLIGAKQTLPTEIVRPLPANFIDYLKADGVYFPKNTSGDKQDYTCNFDDKDDDDDDNNNQEDEDEDDAEDDNNEEVTFPDIEERIRDALDRFKGKLFPKLTWSAPSDAAWISPSGSLACHTVGEVYLLLKSSDNIANDLRQQLFDSCVDKNDDESAEREFEHELVLRKWSELVPSFEFRCFVRNKELVGISQIELMHRPYLSEMAERIECLIECFFENHVRDQFPSNHFVFDVYVKKDLSRVFLIDFNPFAQCTDSILFEWSHLATVDSSEHDEPLLKLYPAEGYDVSIVSTRAMQNCYPVEFTSANTNDPDAVAKWAIEMQRQQEKDASTSLPPRQQQS
ncbi:D123-domain-containing protein [Ramicandelaber brevisporus]|nr:D123-domain-containing protein [Ramicandelaber brevisporus]